MATPPPYQDITGIFTADDKHQKVTLAEYNGLARPGQLVVDTTNYQLYVGNAQGALNPVTGGSGTSPAGSNTQIQFNDAGAFGAVGALTFNKTSNTLGISTQNISANATNLSFSGVMTGNGSGLTNLQPSNMLGMPSAQTLTVDPEGDNTNADGSDNKPFATIQAAHDYANSNLPTTAYIVIKLNAGNYSGNVTLTRPKTAIVGASDGVIRSSWITGSVTVNLTSGIGVVSENIFALENVLVASNSTVITISGNTRLTFFARNVYGYTSDTSADVLNVTNTASGGVKVDLFNSFLQSDGGGTVLSTNNTYYLNMNYCTLAANSGLALRTTTTSGFVTTSRITTETGSNVFVNVSQFAPNTTMSFGVCTFESTATNGNGLFLSAGSVTTLGSCAFNVRAGTGFAVAGATGSVLIRAANNNQIAYNTNGNTQNTVTVLPMSYL